MPFVVLLVLLVASPALAQNVAQRLDAALRQVQGVLGESFARSLPMPSASAGVSYAFDPVTGNFQREPATFGQIYLDRADPLGKGRWNVSFAYTYTRLDALDGHDADDLHDTDPIPVRGKQLALLFERLRIDAAVHQFLFSGTYGVTENLEVSLAIPFAYSDITVDARLRAGGVSAATNQYFEQPLATHDHEGPVGVGDVMLRAKYRLLESRWADVAGGLFLRLPSGSQEALQGVGFVEVAPTLLVSTRQFEPQPWARLQGHLNVAVGFDAEDVDQSEARWGIGLDWGIADSVTASLAFLGRNQFARVAPPGFFDFPRCQTTLRTCATSQIARNGSGPLFGLSSGRPDYYDVSIGGRAGVWRDTIFAFANVVVPLNDGFVRTDPIPLVGIEGTF
jgi:hypothetical protein